MYNILVCDDEKDIVSALTIYLTTSGYQVFPAYDGTEALALLEKEDIHLVLLDIMMPKLDGWQVCREIRVNSQVPIIMLTARDSDSDYVSGLALGSDDYFTKPFRPLKLVMRVKAIFRRIDMEQHTKEWQNNPMLEGELILFLDATNHASLDEIRLFYDEKKGLEWEVEKCG